MPSRPLLLLAPLRYWAIQHPVKRRWDFVIPAIASGILTSFLVFWPKIPSAYVSGGYLVSLQTLFAILGGFFVSSLTLVATSNAVGLTQPISGSPQIRLKGHYGPMSRQRFLSLLFGYLAFSAFCLYATGFIAVLLAPGAKSMLAPILREPISFLFLLLYNFWLSHMFVATLVGLYYFTDRLQRPDPEIFRSPAAGERKLIAPEPVD